jgi:hypothetical protein
VESSSPPSTAATPPWAQRVADWESTPLVRTPTRIPGGLGQADDGRQSGHTTAEDEDVELHGPAPDRAGCSAGSARVSSASSGGPTVDVVDHPLARRRARRSARTASSSASLVVGVGDDDDLVARRTSRAAAPLRQTWPGSADDGVGLEAGAVVDVEDGHLLVLQDVGQGHQLGVDG